MLQTVFRSLSKLALAAIFSIASVTGIFASQAAHPVTSRSGPLSDSASAASAQPYGHYHRGYYAWHGHYWQHRRWHAGYYGPYRHWHAGFWVYF